MTAEVPSGKTVKFADLLADPSTGLAGLAARIRREHPPATEPECVTDDMYDESLVPLWDNYESFALTASGLSLALSESAFGPCSPRITVPWTTVRPFLSRLGRRLVESLKSPTS